MAQGRRRARYEIRGKTLGIVGYGHIGRQVGVLAETMGMRVVFFDIAAKLPMGNNHATKTLDELLAQSDFVTLHVPETPQTRGMFGAREIAAMRPGSYLLNASRGTVVDIDALAAALKSGHLAGAAIDVFPEEPEKNSDGFETPLRGLAERHHDAAHRRLDGRSAGGHRARGRRRARLEFVNAGVTTGAVNFPQIDAAAHAEQAPHPERPQERARVSCATSTASSATRAPTSRRRSSRRIADIGYLVMDLDQDVSGA